MLSAVSPAVVVPSLLSLQEKCYGTKKGVPTLVVAAASLDDILAITGFTIMLSITLSEGDFVFYLKVYVSVTEFSTPKIELSHEVSWLNDIAFYWTMSSFI